MIIGSGQFREEVEGLGFECWLPRDREVYCPSMEWVKGFGEYLVLGRKAGVGECWDCDDFAMEAVAEASEACRYGAIRVGHTFVYCTVRMWGELNGIEVEGDQIVGHATNLVRLNGGEFVFFEPQNGRITDARVAIDNGVVAPVNALL